MGQKSNPKFIITPVDWEGGFVIERYNEMLHIYERFLPKSGVMSEEEAKSYLEQMKD